jgi:hypothetical protein
MNAPTNTAAIAEVRRPTFGLVPPAKVEFAANPVKVMVSTVVVTSGTARRRMVEFRTPMAKASSAITA